MDAVSKYFLLFLLGVAIGSYLLIRYGLKARTKFQESNLQLSPDDVWEIVAERASKSGFLRSNLIYGIYKDITATTMGLIVKDERGQVMGRIEKTTGERQARIFVGETIYLVEYPLSYWNRTIELRSADNQNLLCRCLEKTLPIGKLHYEIPNHPRLVSERKYWNLLYQDNFRSQGRLVGTVQSLSTAVSGRIGILPSEIPLPVRMFILAHPLF